MSARAHLANTAWLVSSHAARAGFERSCNDVEETQRRVLDAVIGANRETVFGKAHSFSRVSTAEAYAELVPLARWEDLEPYVARAAEGERAVLTEERVELLEPTSGTSGPRKLVPVTASLRSAFAQAAAIWVADLYSTFPAARRGRSYWSITPMGSIPRHSRGGIPIGFDEDAQYFGPVRQMLVRWAMAVPGEVRLARDVETARYITLLFLLAAEDLSLISVWSPTFLSALLAQLPSYLPSLAADLSERRIRPPSGIEPPLARSLERRLTHSADRTRDVVSAFECFGATSPDLYRSLWPGLAVISCWADAHAAEAARSLKSTFPGVALQPKGLLSTEAFASLPLSQAADPVLAAGTHYFEFLPKEGAAPVPAWSVEDGGEYELVVTTQGGLYRYRTGDRVRVTGRFRNAPTLRFLGKRGLVSDRVGEKVAESHARDVFDALREAGVRAGFAFIAFSAAHSAYRVYIQAPGDDVTVDAMARIAEKVLTDNPQYEYARRLSQLRPCGAVVLGAGADAAFIDEHVRRGMRAGDVKTTALSLYDDWDRVFAEAGVVPGVHGE